MSAFSEILLAYQESVNKKKFSEALEAAKKMVELNPLIMRSHIILIQEYLRLDDFDNARDACERASYYDPNYPDLVKWKDRVNFLLKKRLDYEKKIILIENELENDDLSFDVLYSFLLICSKSGDRNKLISVLKKIWLKDLSYHQRAALFPFLLDSLSGVLLNNFHDINKVLFTKIRAKDLNSIYSISSESNKKLHIETLQSLYKTQIFHEIKTNDLVEVSPVGENLHCKSNVYLLVSFLPIDKTSTHLAAVAELVRIYQNLGCQVTVFCSLLSLSGTRNLKPFDLEDSDFYVRELSRHIQMLNGGEKVNILAPNTSAVCSSLELHLLSIEKLLASIECSSFNIAIALSGPFACYKLISAFKKLPIRKFLFSTQGADNLFELEKFFDYVLTVADLSDADRKKIKSHFDIEKFIKRKAPVPLFAWETILDNEANAGLQELIDPVDIANRKIVIVTAGEMFSRRMNQEFLGLLNKITDGYEEEDIAILILGDSKEVLLANFPDLERFVKSIFAYRAVDRLYSFFSKLSSFDNVVYLYPRHPGSGRCNAYAIMAGLPVVLFKGNDIGDAVHDYMQHDSVNSIVLDVQHLIADNNFRKNYIDKSILRMNLYNKEAELSMEELLDVEKYPARISG
ncbi:MAG: hypothetical protein PHX60_04205 [Giesbergeria sp.]|uniref:tetratricopeptide repeat protein n=1 Tax=Giesbergeria sp. TaxID=2818473 RepID=UPI0026017528|nr:hypothetical protein [Giesbergeria sp.]MDD2608883.1 hypothetical protein [Giesbergeria sp.]